MYTWRCVVCGYIYYGETPPDECPECGVDCTQFEMLPDEDVRV